MRKGMETTRSKYCMGYKGFKYHPADKNGRLYLCGCCIGFRLGKNINYGFGRICKDDRKGRDSVFLLSNFYNNINKY